MQQLTGTDTGTDTGTNTGSGAQLALLSLFVHSATADASCAAVAVLQVLMSVSAAAFTARSNIHLLEDDDACLAPLPISISRAQLQSMRSVAVGVVCPVVLCCITSPLAPPPPPALASAPARAASPLQRKKQDKSLMDLAEDVFDMHVQPRHVVQKSHGAAATSRYAPAPAPAAAAVRAAPAPAKHAGSLPTRQHGAKSPMRSSSRVFSPDMSLRLELKHPSPPRTPHATLFSSESLSPVQTDYNAISASSQSPKTWQEQHEGGGNMVYVQEKEQRRPQRTPIPRSNNNFLIPVPSTEEAEDE